MPGNFHSNSINKQGRVWRKDARNLFLSNSTKTTAEFGGKNARKLPFKQHKNYSRVSRKDARKLSFKQHKSNVRVWRKGAWKRSFEYDFKHRHHPACPSVLNLCCSWLRHSVKTDRQESFSVGRDMEVGGGYVLNSYHYWSLLYGAILCSRADSLRSCRMWFWMSDCILYIARIFNSHRSGVLTVLLSCCMAGTAKLLLSRRMFCVHHSTTHQFTVSLHSKPQRQGACAFNCNLAAT